MKLSQLRRTPALALVLAIPLLSVLTGATLLFLAVSSANPPESEVTLDQAPMSKTSWRGTQP